MGQRGHWGGAVDGAVGRGRGTGARARAVPGGRGPIQGLGGLGHGEIMGRGGTPVGDHHTWARHPILGHLPIRGFAGVLIIIQDHERLVGRVVGWRRSGRAGYMYEAIPTLQRGSRVLFIHLDWALIWKGLGLVLIWRWCGWVLVVVGGSFAEGFRGMGLVGLFGEVGRGVRRRGPQEGGAGGLGAGIGGDSGIVSLRAGALEAPSRVH
jgi:hypothetical protein